jgi:hypothetical protein
LGGQSHQERHWVKTGYQVPPVNQQTKNFLAWLQGAELAALLHLEEILQTIMSNGAVGKRDELTYGYLVFVQAEIWQRELHAKRDS